MSHKKKQAQGSQQTGQRDGNQSQNPNRDQAERQRQQMPGSDQTDQRQAQDPDGNRRSNQGNSANQDHQGEGGTHTPERARRTQGERNASSSGGGISNRGMDSEEEQEDVPIRGSEREPGDSER